MSEQQNTITRDELHDVILTILNKNNGNGNSKIPRTWIEFAWMLGLSWGPLGLMFVVLLYLSLTTGPKIAESAIQVQQSLVKNLDIQTANIEQQTETMLLQTRSMEQLQETMEEVRDVEKETQMFMPQVLADHQKQMTDLQSIKSAVDKPNN